MSLAVQLWYGYMATHPAWLDAAACCCVMFLFLLAGATLTGDDRMTVSREYDLDRFADDWAAAIRRRGHITNPPAGLHPPLTPAGDVPGPGSSHAPAQDGVLPSAVHAPGPGTPRNGPPWEQCCHDPGHDHAPGLWGPDAHHQQVTAAIGGR